MSQVGEVNFRETMIPAKVGSQSLVGFGREPPPHRWGNYFNFAGKGTSWGPRCVNMWAENLREAAKKFLQPDGMVKVRIYTEGDRKQWCLVVDERIPKDWLYHNLCFTGDYRPSLETIKHMYEFGGDPENAFEEYYDPKEYHRKRGMKYLEFKMDDGTVISKITCEKPVNNLTADWKVDVIEDAGLFYCPYVPKALLKTAESGDTNGK